MQNVQVILNKKEEKAIKSLSKSLLLTTFKDIAVLLDLDLVSIKDDKDVVNVLKQIIRNKRDVTELEMLSTHQLVRCTKCGGFREFQGSFGCRNAECIQK